MVGERARFRPVAQIVGRRAFWGREFAVTARGARPAAGDRDAGGAALAGPAPATVLDLGTGSGAILRHAARRMAGGARARHRHRSRRRWRSRPANAARLGVAERARFARGRLDRGARGALRPRGLEPALHRRGRGRGARPGRARLGAAARADAGADRARRPTARIAAGLAAAAGAGRAGAPRDRRRRRARRWRRCCGAAGLRAASRCIRDLDGRDRVVEVAERR